MARTAPTAGDAIGHPAEVAESSDRRAHQAARAEAESIIQRWNDRLALGRDCGRPQSGRRCAPARHGSMFSAPAAALARRSISAPMPKLIGLFALPPAMRADVMAL